MKILSVYNICGISKKENISFYKTALKSLIQQTGVDQDIVISACLCSDTTIQQLNNFFPNIKINHIKEKVPVNVSFNHTCRVFDDGEYDVFLYIDSGVIFKEHQTLLNMSKRMKSGPYAMTCCVTDTDQGVSMDNIGGLYAGDGLVSDDLGACVSIGSSLNLHCQMFSREIKDFFGNIIPDIFAGYCTESVFTFLCASLKRRWAVTKDMVSHVVSVDGQSSGFHPSLWTKQTGRESYDHPFAIDSYMERISNPLAADLGLGFEECRKVLMHKKSEYDGDMFCINDNLKFYIKNNLYLKNTEFDYNKINYTIIKNKKNKRKTKNKDQAITDPAWIDLGVEAIAPQMGLNGWSIDYKISIIIPTRDRTHLLEECLLSILNNSYQKERLFEIILLVDNDDHKTIQKAIDLQKRFVFTNSLDKTECNSLSVIIVPKSEYMQRDYNNAGAIAAKGELVFVLNDDAIINTKNWDKKIYDFYKQNQNQDDIMMIAIPDNTHNGISNDSLGNIRSSDTHGPCFPIVTKTFIKCINGIFPSNIRMWGADLILYNIFKTIQRVYYLTGVEITHKSFHSKNREKDDINKYIEEISNKHQYMISIPEYISYIQYVINSRIKK